MTKIGEVIGTGHAIPPDVTEVEDSDADRWTLRNDGWDLNGSSETYVGKTAKWLSQYYAPLTVTAVREPEPDECSLCRAEPGEAHNVFCPTLRPLRQQPASPLVLSLPQVPEGAVALITRNQDGDEVRFIPAPERPGSWVMASGAPTGDWLLVEILRAFDGSVTVVMREPRTWPRLDTISDDLKAVRGASGKVYHRSHFSQSVPVFRERGNDGDPLTGPGHMFYALQTFDGPLTEVFDDEPGGEPR